MMSVEPDGAGWVVEGAGTVVGAVAVVDGGAGTGPSAVVEVAPLPEQAAANSIAATATDHRPVNRSGTG